MDAIKKSTETLIDVSEEVGLEVNTEKIKCVCVYIYIDNMYWT
jgi:hypothetical protein